jgi:tripartite-type tricarboxylate transporter receptor subunit TctC
MKLSALSAIVLFCATLAGAANAENYPNRPVVWVVPYSAGSGADNSARVVARVLGDKLGQSVLIDNRPGAGGIVGTESVASAKPDGYTILFGSSGPMATFMSLYKKLSYDPVKSFIPVHTMASNPYVMLVNPSRPYKTFAEFLDYAKQHPDKINSGSPGSGTSNHLAGELLQAVAGIKMTHVPYKSSAAQIADLLSGVLDVSFEMPNGMRTLIEAGKVRPLAMTSDRRMKNFPDVPTFAELGLPDMKIAAWSSIVVPAGTPLDVVQKLDSAITATLKDPAIAEYYSVGDSLVLDQIGYREFPAYLASETAKFKALIEKSGATTD